MTTIIITEKKEKVNMTTHDYLTSLDEEKVVLPMPRYQFLMGELAKLTAIEISAREGTLTPDSALRIIGDGASKEDFA